MLVNMQSLGTGANIEVARRYWQCLHLRERTFSALDTPRNKKHRFLSKCAFFSTDVAIACGCFEQHFDLYNPHAVCQSPKIKLLSLSGWKIRQMFIKSLKNSDYEKTTP